VSTTTRERILDAAHALIEERGAADVGLAEIGRAAGVSRQSVYLHFGSRGALMRELMAHINRRTDLAALAQPVREAPDAVAELEAFVALQSVHNPRVAAAARALEASRRSDPAAAEAWEVVRAERRAACRRIVDRLAAERRLAAGWDPDAAADLLYALTSLGTWEELCRDLGWPAEAYRAHVAAALRATLVSPDP